MIENRCEIGLNSNQRKEMAFLSCLAPHIRNHVEVVMRHPNFGLSQKSITFMNPKPSCSADHENSQCDRFKISIPYAGMSVECLVIFQSSAPHCPPDFLFSDCSFIIPLENIKSLCDWNFENPDGLLLVVKELMYFYKEIQIAQLENYADLYIEYLNLIQLPNMSEDDIEVFVSYNKNNPITFLIQLHIELANILPNVFLGNVEEETILLLVTFPLRNVSRSTQRLYLSANISNAFELSPEFHLPPLLSTFSFKEYIPALEDALKKNAALVASAYEKRKECVSVLLSHFENCLIEYDVLLYMKLTLLLELKGFHFLLEIDFPRNFPIGVPELIFRSVYHTYSGAPTSVSIDSYSYSPNWSSHELLEEIVKFIHNYASLFQQDSA
ncbi:BRCA1-A complex subunit BRE, partial [Stegodyphus mimosarum]